MSQKSENNETSGIYQSPEGHDELHRWFELSYASFLTLPRVLMYAMPDEWQGKIAELLNEYDEAFPNQPDIGTRVQITRDGKLVKSPEWLLNYRRPDYEEIERLRGKKDISEEEGSAEPG